MTCFCQISIKFLVYLLIKYFCKSRYIHFSVENINGVHELMYKAHLLRVSDVLLMFVESRYLYVYGNTLVEFAAYFSTRSVRGLSYTLLTAIEN